MKYTAGHGLTLAGMIVSVFFIPYIAAGWVLCVIGATVVDLLERGRIAWRKRKARGGSW